MTNIDPSAEESPTPSQGMSRLASGWLVLFLGTVAALLSSVVSFSISNTMIRQMDWRLHPQISGSTDYFLTIFLFELFVLPVLFASVMMVALPLLYVWRKRRGAKLPVFRTILALLVVEAAFIALMLFGMESFLFLVTLNIALAAVCTALSVGLILKVANNPAV